MKAQSGHQQSLLATKKLLLDVINNPNEFINHEKLKKALKSQGALAKYDDSERGIIPCSLNTIKKCANNILVRGFTELDEVRVNARFLIEQTKERKNKSNHQTLTGLKLKVKELERDIEILEKHNVMLSVLVSRLRDDLRQLVKRCEDNKLLIEYKEKIKSIDAILSYLNIGNDE